MKLPNRTLYLCAITSALSLSTGCTPKNPSQHSEGPALSSTEMEMLSDQMKDALVKKLKEEAQISAINKVEVLDSKQNKDGSVQMSYTISYDTESEEAGRVTHILDAQATLEAGSEHWKISAVDPKTEELIFSKPLDISAVKK